MSTLADERAATERFWRRCDALAIRLREVANILQGLAEHPEDLRLLYELNFASFAHVLDPEVDGIIDDGERLGELRARLARKRKEQ
jgi:hypothetical protein